MLRIIAVALLGLYLVAIGLWPPAAAPIGAAVTGLAVIVGLIPGPAWLGLGVIAWLRNRPAPAQVVAD
ncbi:hypothetical protein [Streptomyces echinatus]|uniref:Uncharacterized protein n=1 Tax=Streptomyces echinatus TaxID=67293 RepID=A0A7W9Q499_9ACTN|nr:hypothetical protein [Streptomyces echinatus]MBB5932332.1 hypothetical protein [Streptomyces echinatus]